MVKRVRSWLFGPKVTGPNPTTEYHHPQLTALDWSRSSFLFIMCTLVSSVREMERRTEEKLSDLALAQDVLLLSGDRGNWQAVLRNLDQNAGIFRVFWILELKNRASWLDWFEATFHIFRKVGWSWSFCLHSYILSACQFIGGNVVTLMEGPTDFYQFEVPVKWAWYFIINQVSKLVIRSAWLYGPEVRSLGPSVRLVVFENRSHRGIGRLRWVCGIVSQLYFHTNVEKVRVVGTCVTQARRPTISFC